MIYVILVNWNSWHYTQECIKSLTKIVDIELKIIVCDNNSSDQSVQKLNELRDTLPIGYLQVVNTGGNLGFAGGNNVGIKIALSDPRTSYIWILNNDTTVDQFALSKLVEMMQSDQNIGICGSTLLFAHDPHIIQAVGGKYNSWLGLSSHILGGIPYSVELCDQINPDTFDYVVGASMLVSRRFIEEVGLMDEQYFLYCEELDWATRAKIAGYKLGYAPLSLIYHKEGGTTGSASYLKRSSRSSIADHCSLRSHLIYSIKFYPLRHIIVRGTYLIKFITRIIRLDWIGSARTLYAMFLVWK